MFIRLVIVTLKLGKKGELNFQYLVAQKESAFSAGDLGSIPVLGGYPKEGNSKPLQYSCLENSMDRGATIHGVAKSWTQLKHVS